MSKREQRHQMLCVSTSDSQTGGLPGTLKVMVPTIHQMAIKVDGWEGPLELLAQGRLVADNKDGTDKLPEPYRAVHYLGNQQFLVITTGSGRGKIVDHIDAMEIVGQLPQNYTDIDYLVATPEERAARDMQRFTRLEQIRQEDAVNRRAKQDFDFPLYAGLSFGPGRKS